MLSREEILGAKDLEFVEELIPEWPDKDGKPGVARFRQLSAEDALALTEEMNALKKDRLFLLLVRTMCDENGTPVFAVDDIPSLKKKNIRVLIRLQRISMKLNSMVDIEEGEIKKPSGEEVIAASPIDSPEN